MKINVKFIFQSQSSDESVSVGRGSSRARRHLPLQRPRRPGVAGSTQAMVYTLIAHIAWGETALQLQLGNRGELELGI